MKKGLYVLVMIFFASIAKGQTWKENFLSGMQKHEIKDYKGAIIDFTKVLETTELDSSKYSEMYAGLYFYRGMSKKQLKDFRGALNDMSKSLVLFRNSPLSGEGSDLKTINMMALTFYGRGLVYIDLKDYENALIDISEAIKLNDKDGSFFMVRGDTKRFLGLIDSACLDFSRAGELGVDNAYERIKMYCN